jgi:predicted transcriptional regulator
MNLRLTKVVSGTTLRELTKILAHNHISGAPAVNSNNEIIGFVSQQDRIIELAEKMGDHKPKTYPVTENGKLVGVLARQHASAGLQQNQQHCGAW